MRTLEDRIDRLFRRDRLLALTFTAAMWLALVLVFVRAAGVLTDPAIVVVLGVAMVLLGGLNTASTIALIGRYRAARESVYRSDVEFSDRRRALRAERARS